jgi:hypothetical protein
MEKYEWSGGATGRMFRYYSDEYKPIIRDELIEAGQRRYKLVTSALGRAGTEVYQRKIIGSDPNLDPDKFIEGATHEYVFPRQPVQNYTKIKTYLGDRGHRIVKEVMDDPKPFDETLVRGRLRLSYDVSQVPPRLVLEDLLGNSDPVISEEVMSDIEKAFTN